MTTLKAKKSIYIHGSMVSRGGLYQVDDRIAAKHIAQGKGEAMSERSKPIAENRRTKPGAQAKRDK